MATLAADINNPDKPAANPDPHPLTPIPVPVNAVICPTCRLPITDGPYQLDGYGIRYHKDCGVAPHSPKVGEKLPDRKKDDTRSVGAHHQVHDTRLPFMETSEKYREKSEEMEKERKENEEREQKDKEEIAKRAREDERERAKDRNDRNDRPGQPTVGGAQSAAKVTTPPHTR